MAAAMLSHAINRADALGLGAFMFFQPINEGAIIVEPLLTSRLTATGQVFSLLKAHCGNRRLTVSGNDGNPDLQTLASADDAGNIILTVINRSYSAPAPFSLDKKLPKNQTATLLDGSAEIIPATSFKIIDGMTVKDKKGGFVVPARSVLQIELKIKN
jgi:hypothetical protein